MSEAIEDLVARFEIDVGGDLDTGDEVASIVRDDGLHLNLQFVDALIDLGERYPEALDALAEMVYSLIDPPESAMKN